MSTTTEEPKTAEQPAKSLKDELVEVVAAEKCEESTKLAIVDGFSSFLTQSDQWEKDAYALKVTDIAQTAEMKEAKESRLALRRIRINIEKKHKEVKADALARCRAIDAAKRFLCGKIEPLEAHLKEQEEFVDRYLEEQRQKRVVERTELLRAETDTDPHHMNLGEMTDEEFNAVLQQGKDAKAGRLERERKAEEERIAREKAEQEERERIERENARLKAEAEERERIYKLGSDRAGYLRDINTEPGDIAELGKMSDSKFDDLYTEAKEAYHESQRKAKEAAEKRQAQHKATIKRQLAMQEVGGPTDYDELAAMSETDFTARLQAATEAHEAKLKQEREEALRKQQEEQERLEREKAEKAHQAMVISRQEEMREVGGNTDFAHLSALSKDEYQAVLQAATDTHRRAQEAKRKAEEEQRAERERLERVQKEHDQALEASVKSAAGHAALIVIETAEAWADRHPDVENGRAIFVDAVVKTLEGGAE